MSTASAPPPPVSTFDFAIASGAKGKFQLRDVLFAATEGRVLAAREEGTSLNVDLQTVDVRWHREGSDLRVVVPYAVNIIAKRDGVPSPGVLAEIRVLLRVDYEIISDVTVSEIHHFIGLTTFIHSWPYFRAEVAELTTKLRLPPLTLPVAVSGNAEQFFIVSKLEPEPGATESAQAP